MAKKTTKTTKTTPVEEETQTRSNLFDYLRFGESYTSLILGIIVVVISTVLLLSFVHNRNIIKNDAPQLLSQKDIALPSIAGLTGGPAEENEGNTPIEEQAEAPTVTEKPAPTQTPSPTAAPTKKAEPTKTVAAAKPSPTPVKVSPTPANAKAPQGTTKPVKSEYTVVAGDNLWIIAEKQYKSGYNWVDIARTNKLSNPGMIKIGQKLKLPNVEQKIATITEKPETKSDTKGGVAQEKPEDTKKITGDSYKIVKGDTLWDIAVRAYGDGYQWSKIASTNNLPNPDLIHTGNTLKIPRDKK